MKSIITSITIVLFLAACEKEELEVIEREVVVEREIVNFPHDMTLVDTQDRSIEATLIGRSGDIVFFEKQNSSQIFEYPISDLSAESKIVIKSMPVTEISIKTKENEEEDQYIAHREQEIEKLKKEIRDLNYELLEARGDSARTRGINNAIRRIELEIAKERQDIEDYQFEQKQ